MLSLSPCLNPPHLPLRINAPLLHGTFLSFKPHSRKLRDKAYGPNSASMSKNTVTPAEEQQQEEFQVLTATRSEYNNIVILESRNAKVLLLDDSGNVHSMLYNDRIWTSSYWDEFCSLPAIIPRGAIAVFGLGGGTVAHQLLHFWPSLHVDGWELDEVLIDRARQFFSLSELEISNVSGGILRVCIGDALSPLASVEGGYAGIIVDLFSDAKILPELGKVETWLEMKRKLMPGGRIMVNCGGVSQDSDILAVERGWEVISTIQTMCRAFGGSQVNWKRMPENESGNFLAFTGPLPDLETWSASVPEKLSPAVKLWKPCDP